MSGPAITQTDVAIIGAGPVGLFAVFACGQLGMRCAVVDALPAPGGQLTALYPEKPIYDIPGRPEVRADALVSDLMAQAAPYAPAILLDRRAENLTEDGEGFRLRCSDGMQVQARAVVLAAGPGAFGPNRPPLPGIDAYEGTSVHYHVIRREAFAGRRVVIAGGGDSAVDWAVSLAEIAASVTVVHRRDKFRATPAMVALMRSDPRITLRTGWQLAGLAGDAPTLSGVMIASSNGDTQTLPADDLLALFGLATDLGPLQDWDIALSGKQVSVDPATCQTSRPGVFAIGDLAVYPGKRKLILTGFAEAAAAAEAAFARVFPGRPLHHEHSTSRGAPGASASPELATT